MPIPIDKLVAPPNVRPDQSEWQVAGSNPPRPYGSPFKPEVKPSADLSRVLGLPRRPIPDKEHSDALIRLMTARYARSNTSCDCASRGRKCITTLRRAQAWALYEIGLVGGLLAQIGVGHGKTLLGLLAPFALKAQPGQIVILLCPPGNIGEVIDEYELAGQHFMMPSLTVHGTRYVKQMPGTPALHVMPYSRLSRPEATGWITSVDPIAILADETDKLRNPQTATTARVLRQFALAPYTKFCGWTGSLTDSSIEDYAHLAALALKGRSPLPLNPAVVKDWARALDPSDYPAPAGALLQLCAPGESLHQGYQRRFRETEGIITITESAIATPLIITERQAPPLPPNVDEALNHLREYMERPDGEEFADGLAVARCAREIACGFYNRWIFPNGEPTELIEEWFRCRKAWYRELRGYLFARREGADSEKLAENAARRYYGDLPPDPTKPVWAAESWPAWRNIAPKVIPATEAVRLSDYLVQDAIEWGRQNVGIIWYGHVEIGEWIAELGGFPRHGGGPKAREKILAERGDRTIVASIKSHGRGRNGLQFRFDKQLIASPPSSATGFEQLLGRLHRTGQESGTVYAEYYAHTQELASAVAEATRRAVYVHGTMGASQKILKRGKK